MDIDSQLQKLRQEGDVALRPCPLIAPAFRQIPPHKVGITHLILKPRFLLADPVGCGKTPQALCAYAFLKQKNPDMRMLVMATGSSIFQWSRSVNKFLIGVKPKVVGYDLKTGNPVTRDKRYAAYHSPADVMILSYHQMARDVNYILEHLHNLVVVFDEVQTAKSHEQRMLFPNAQQLSAKAQYSWGLTATPIMNRLAELYAIFEVIYPGFFGSFQRFDEAYHQKAFETVWSSKYKRPQVVSKVVGYQNVQQLMAIIRPFFLRRPSKEIDKFLPIPVTKDVKLTMDSQQSHDYDQIVRDLFLPRPGLKSRRIRGKLASLIYAQLAADVPQVLGLTSEGAKWTELRRILIEEVFGEKVIIYSRFRKVLNWLSGKLAENNLPHVSITGAVNKLDRDKNKELFNTSPDVNIILINDAGGEAVDLQAAGIMVFFDLPWSWGKFTQIVGRSRRMGSTFDKILLILLACRGTIDEKVYDTLYDKENLADETFGVDTRALEISPDTIDVLYESMRQRVSVQ